MPESDETLSARDARDFARLEAAAQRVRELRAAGEELTPEDMGRILAEGWGTTARTARPLTEIASGLPSFKAARPPDGRPHPKEDDGVGAGAGSGNALLPDAG